MFNVDSMMVLPWVFLVKDYSRGVFTFLGYMVAFNIKGGSIGAIGSGVYGVTFTHDTSMYLVCWAVFSTLLTA